MSLRKSPCGGPTGLAPPEKAKKLCVYYCPPCRQRHSLYVPEELVGDIQLALENGRRLKDLISIAMNGTPMR